MFNTACKTNLTYVGQSSFKRLLTIALVNQGQGHLVKVKQTNVKVMFNTYRVLAKTILLSSKYSSVTGFVTILYL